ncbi:MAG: winged-helix domain-containing protein [Ruminococcaceae bacterium]|nr:winged-helix domain-containing protein [Oscillospiraceae bacterium]
MNYQIAIYSTDEIFSRMIELEFLFLGKSVFRAAQAEEHVFSDTVILDLDTATPPPSDCYRRMIGFTNTTALSADDARRKCSMILHRPFEIRLLRSEVLGENFVETARGSLIQPPKNGSRRLQIKRTESCVSVDGVNISLSPRELDVMELMLASRGEPVSRTAISERIGESSANKADVYICYLRRKFEAAVGDRLIATVRGKGYRIS